MPAHFNFVDLLLLAVIALGLWGGWRRGFIAGAVSLLVLAMALLASLWGYRGGAGLLQAYLPAIGVWAAPVAFILIFILVRVLLGALASRLFGRVPAGAHRHGVNRFLGLAPGLALGLVNAAILALLLLTLPLVDRLTIAARESQLAGRLAAPAEWLESHLRPVFEDAVTSTLGRLIVTPGSRERIDLPFNVKQAPPRPELEARMLGLVNQERARRGLPALQPDPDLTPVARAHSADMFARGYFSHVSPDGSDPFDRIRQAQVRYLTAGENLALARTLELAHQGLMESPGHRANILRPTFGRVGIGVLDGGRYGLMVTQVFRN
ncbi:CvpA family protein [Ramlibacter sp. AW1]|uniref:CvpA family protein n=1 Tax=Ramlibacter aurantiacus TaxID=2801330 RepID=A0A937D4C4_9BURK|nr:CvpA family protein [Ramlibacter aurantiacus]MBL0420187.1 CvpA family protein [Ramlibacter aurantiacus]